MEKSEAQLEHLEAQTLLTLLLILLLQTEKHAFVEKSQAQLEHLEAQVCLKRALIEP